MTAASRSSRRQGEGTCFIVTLPAKVAAPSEQGGAAAEPDPAETART